MSPTAENILSAETVIAGLLKYCFAGKPNMGYLLEFTLHQSSTFLLEGSCISSRNRSTLLSGESLPTKETALNFLLGEDEIVGYLLFHLLIKNLERFPSFFLVGGSLSPIRSSVSAVAFHYC